MADTSTALVPPKEKRTKAITLYFLAQDIAHRFTGFFDKKGRA
jgi:hypothetical protein